MNMGSRNAMQCASFPSYLFLYLITNRLVGQCEFEHKGCSEPHQQSHRAWLYMISGDISGCEAHISN